MNFFLLLFYLSSSHIPCLFLTRSPFLMFMFSFLLPCFYVCFFGVLFFVSCGFLFLFSFLFVFSISLDFVFLLLFSLCLVPHISVWGSCFFVVNPPCSRRRLLRLLSSMLHMIHLIVSSSHHLIISSLSHHYLIIISSFHHHIISSLSHHYLIIISSLSHHLIISSSHHLIAQYPEPLEGVAARGVAAGPRLLFLWQAQYPEPLEGVAARGVAAGPRLLCRRWAAASVSVAGAISRASRRGCGAQAGLAACCV